MGKFWFHSPAIGRGRESKTVWKTPKNQKHYLPPNKPTNIFFQGKLGTVNLKSYFTILSNDAPYGVFSIPAEFRPLQVPEDVDSKGQFKGQVLFKGHVKGQASTKG